MKKEKFNYDEHFKIFEMLYSKYNVSIEDCAIILKSNSFTIRKYLKRWKLYDELKSKHRNKLNLNTIRENNGGWNKIRNINKCEACNWEGVCDRAHIIPKKDGGTFSKVNVLILCPNCHRSFDNGTLDLSYLYI